MIQPFISNVKLSGVLFTHDMITGAPYFVINYDDFSGRTDTITSGKSSDFRTIILFRNNAEGISKIDPRLKKVIDAVQELEQLLGYNRLDIEFAIDNNDQCFTFQIRPITVNHKQFNIKEKNFEKNLLEAQKKFKSIQLKPPHLHGDIAIYSRMTDWNPAEIIGTRPNVLAKSLYDYLITDEVWAKQRVEFGYRDVRPAPLLYNFCAQPYVDCRASINSFIPSDLNDECASRLTNAYLNILREKPHLHDKLELDIVFTTWEPNFKKHARERFKNQNISSDDIIKLEEALKKITANALSRLNEDISSIKILKQRFNDIKDSNVKRIDKICQLVEDCREFGTLAFAHAARAGFVAITLLRSLVKSGDLSNERLLEFQKSIPTVASDFQFSLSNNLDIELLIKKFGHLRPGTYDVNQLAYWENPEFYFNKNKEDNQNTKINSYKFEFNQKEIKGLKNIIDELQTEVTVTDLIKYFEEAIKSRESTKFNFTKNLSLL